MKKKIILLLAAMLAVSAVALTGCGSKPVVTTADFNQEETAVAGALADVSARFALPTEGSAVIKLTTYHKGQKKSDSEMRGVQGADGNNYLYISGVNSSGLDYVWTLTAPGGRLVYPTPYYSVEDGQSMIRITDVGETEFDLSDGKEHLLYYTAYKSGNDSSTISEKPFHEWSNTDDKDAVLKQFDCVYLITIAQQAESQS